MDTRNELSMQPGESEKIEDSVSLTDSTATESEENAAKNPAVEKETEKSTISVSLIEPVNEESQQEDKSPAVESIVVDIPSDSEEEPAPSIAAAPIRAKPNLTLEKDSTAPCGAGLAPTPRTPRFEDFAEKNLPLSDDESTSEGFEKDFANEFAKLFKTWNLLNKKTQKSRAWMLQDLMNHFTAAKTYDLDEEEMQILTEDLKAVNEVLNAEEAFINSKVDEENFDVSLQKALQSKLANLLTYAAKEPSSKREIFIKIGVALSILALGITIGVLMAGLSPFIVAGCVLATVALLVSTAITKYHLSNHTFFGQLRHNHGQMADLAISAADALEPEKVGCFG